MNTNSFMEILLIIVALLGIFGVGLPILLMWTIELWIELYKLFETLVISINKLSQRTMEPGPEMEEHE